MTDPTIQSTARTLPGSWDEEKQQQVGSVRFGFLKFDLHNWNHAEFQVCLCDNSLTMWPLSKTWADVYVRSPLFQGGWPHSTFMLTSNTRLNNEMVNVFICFFPIYFLFHLVKHGKLTKICFFNGISPSKTSNYSSSKKKCSNPELNCILFFAEWMPNQSQKMMVNLQEYTVYVAALIALVYLVCWTNVVKDRWSKFLKHDYIWGIYSIYAFKRLCHCCPKLGNSNNFLKIAVKLSTFW